jgi:nucleoid-associated protein EbfC
MTEPPEDLLGGFDIGALLEQAQEMQAGLQQAQAELAKQTIEGSVAGGAVGVTVSGVGELVGVRVDPGVVVGDDVESLTDLGDLIVAAYRDAKSQADRLATQALDPIADGLRGGLPGSGDVARQPVDGG